MGPKKEPQELRNERRAAWERSGGKKNERHAAWHAFRKTQNERHAAWERSAKMRNERHAAWERFFAQPYPLTGPKGSLKKCSKPFKTNTFECFWEVHGSTRACAPKKWISPSGRHRSPRAMVQKRKPATSQNLQAHYRPKTPSPL